MSSKAYVKSLRAIEIELERYTRWEEEYTDELSQCDDDGLREMLERSLSIAVNTKQKKLMEIQRIEELAVLSFMFPSLF
jgi:hypothetical protein